MSVGSVQASELDVVLTGVGPVDAVVDKVQREAVGPGDLVLHDHAPVGAVHADPPDVRDVPPVRPVQVAGHQDTTEINSIYIVLF